MSVSGYRGRRFEPQHLYVVSLSKTLYLHCFSRLSCVPGGDNLVKGVQCYELFGGKALKNHALFYFKDPLGSDNLVLSLLLSQIYTVICLNNLTHK